MNDVVNVLMFICAFSLVMVGYPVAFTLAGTAIFFAFVGHWFDLFPLGHLAFMGQRMYGIMTNDTLVAVPLFVFMGLMLERSKIAEDLLTGMAALFGRRPGGLALSVVLVGSLLAASTGIVGATVVTMGLLGLPVMLKHGYDARFSCGTICASGTLGQIVPPSIVLIFLGDFLTYASQQANMKMGQVGQTFVSVSDLFAGALLPSMLLISLYVLYVLWMGWRHPEKCPALVGVFDSEHRKADLVRALVPPVMLVVAVLGSILLGIATPTEAASVGAIGAVLLGAARAAPRLTPLLVSGVVAAVLLVFLKAYFDLRFQRDVVPLSDAIAIGIAAFAVLVIAAASIAAMITTGRIGMLQDVLYRSARITAMVFTVLIGASLFTLVFRGFGGEEAVKHFFDALPGGLFAAMLFTMLVIFLLGFFLDFMEIIFIVIPIVAPILIMMGADPLWLGVMIAVNLQTSFLTPPFGFALFYLRSVAPDSVSTPDIYRGAVPYIGIQLLGLILVASFPALATWLPKALF